MSTYIGIAGSEDDLPPGGSPGNVLTLDANGQPVWVAPSSGATGALLIANNLNDVADKPTSRTNIGAASLGANTFTGDQIIASGNLLVSATSYLGWLNRAAIQSQVAGSLLLTDSAGTDFSRLQFGGTTNAFPAIKRNGAALSFVQADDSGPCSISAGGGTFGATVAAPAARTLTIGDSATGSNIAGGNGIIRAGTGTGTGAATSKLIFQTCDTVAAGSGAQTYTQRVQFDVNGITAQGAISAGSHISVTAPSFIYWAGRCLMGSPADGVMQFTNSAQTDFTRLNLGGSTGAFPAIKRNNTVINFRLASDTADCGITALNLTVSENVYMIKSSVAWVNNAAAAAGTLTNAPVAGNPTKWIAINDAGTVRYVPTW